jgi:hypothetical protein
MKLFLALFALIATQAQAATPEFEYPYDQYCNKLPGAAEMQTAIIRDLREQVTKADPEKNAYTFRFTTAWGLTEADYKTTVYFETLRGGDQESRKAYVAQYSVDKKTCESKFLKKSLLVGGEAATVERLDGFEDKEKCNFADGQEKMIAATIRSAKWAVAPTMGVSELGNFSFTGIKRVNGSADAYAVYTAQRFGQLPTNMVVLITVDPKTCEVSTPSYTSFTNTYVTY